MVSGNPLHSFIQGDISDRALLKKVFNEFKPDKTMSFAAGSHVGRSITGSSEYFTTNIIRAYSMLEEVLKYDEVYGELGETGRDTI